MDALRLRSLDSETPLILPGGGAPSVVCGSWMVEGGESGLAAAEGFFDRVAEALESGDLLVLANGAFDFACAGAARPDLLPAIFRAYREGRVHDVLISEALHAIYHGHLGGDPRRGIDLRTGECRPLVKPSTGKEVKRYSLEVVCDLVLGRVDAKARDTWRKSYGLLRGIPIERWPEEARLYPIDDVRNPLDVARAQLRGRPCRHEWEQPPRIPGSTDLLDPERVCRHCGETEGSGELNGDPCPKAPPIPPHRNQNNLAAQAVAAFALHLGACWSLRTDPEKVAALAAEVEAKHAAAVERFQKQGWIRQDGTEDQVAVKKAVALAYGASGVCKRCGGSGKVRPTKTKPCRGEKVRGRYQGCAGDGSSTLRPLCPTCGGSGEISYLGDEVVCKASENEYRCPCGEMQFLHPSGGVTCPRGHRQSSGTIVTGCDGTGLDLGSVGAVLPRTDKGGVSTDRSSLLESGDDDIAAYGENEFEKIRTTQIPWLRTGIDRPLSYGVNALLTSGRASYEGGPMHQMTREGGERACIRARGAWCDHPFETVLGSSDYGAGELCALGVYSYYLFGRSDMLRYINESGDPGVLHSVLGAEVVGVTLDEFLVRIKSEKQIKLIRQAMKPISFGAPAAMSAWKIVLTARLKTNGFTVCADGPASSRKNEPGHWGIRFCVTIGGAARCGASGMKEFVNKKSGRAIMLCAKCVEIVKHVLMPAYFKRFPEIEEYHAWGKRAVRDRDALSQTLLWDEREERPVVVRERHVSKGELPTFLNNPFQSMIADITKSAYVNATRECYLGVKDDGSPSPLAGCRLPAFMHDELISEIPLAVADPAGRRVTEVMVGTASRLAPACKAWKADTALAYWLSKGMEPVHKDGKLVPWDQAKMDAWLERHPECGRMV